MKYGYTDYNLSVEDALRELDNFAKYGIDLGEKDHEKFFIERWLKVRDDDLDGIEELKAEIEDLEDRLDDCIDEEEYYELEEEADALRDAVHELKKNYTVLDSKGNKIDWDEFRMRFGY